MRIKIEAVLLLSFAEQLCMRRPGCLSEAADNAFIIHYKRCVRGGKAVIRAFCRGQWSVPSHHQVRTRRDAVADAAFRVGTKSEKEFVAGP